MSSWSRVAKIGKPKNLNGGLLVYAYGGLPFLLKEGMEVFFVPPVLRAPRAGCIEHIAEQGVGAFVVSFDSIDSIDLAEKLQDHYCLVRDEDLPEGFERGLVDLVGLRIEDRASGFTGIIIDIEDNPAHPLLVVSPDVSGEVQEHALVFRIPLVDDFIISDDLEGGTLVMDLPRGLVGPTSEPNDQGMIL